MNSDGNLKLHRLRIIEPTHQKNNWATFAADRFAALAVAVAEVTVVAKFVSPYLGAIRIMSAFGYVDAVDVGIESVAAWTIGRSDRFPYQCYGIDCSDCV